MDLRTCHRSTTLFAAMVVALCCPRAACALEDVSVLNGAFTDGGDYPDGWAADGRAAFARDVEVFRSAPASVRIQVSKGAVGSVGQMIEAGGARVIKISGSIKSESTVEAVAAVQVFSADWDRTEWMPLSTVKGTCDWTGFEGPVSLPDWTARFRITFWMRGVGKIWVDDVTIDGKPPRIARHVDPLADEPPYGKPWEPAWCIENWRAHWMEQHNAFVARSRQGDVDVVLWGDSITKALRDRWQEALSPSHVVNYGIGGDSTRQLLWRITHGEAEGIAPRLVILNIGTNNLYANMNGGSDEEIVRGISACLAEIREALPKARVLLVGVLPRKELMRRVNHLNDLESGLADGRMVQWLDLRSVFADVGLLAPRPELFGEDLVHPNEKGYESMLMAMRPTVVEMLSGGGKGGSEARDGGQK